MALEVWHFLSCKKLWGRDGVDDGGVRLVCCHVKLGVLGLGGEMKCENGGEDGWGN